MQAWSPQDREPVEFVDLNVDFHPAWAEERLREAGLRVGEQRAVSAFRVGLLKHLMPTAVPVTLDRVVQPGGGFLPVSPSVFVRCETEVDRPPPGELERRRSSTTQPAVRPR